jgi:hypothetical protein
MAAVLIGPTTKKQEQHQNFDFTCRRKKVLESMYTKEEIKSRG